MQTACCVVFVAATGPLSGCADPGGKDPPHGAEEPPSFLSYRGNSRKGVLMTDGEGGTAVYERDGRTNHRRDPSTLLLTRLQEQDLQIYRSVTWLETLSTFSFSTT